METNFYALSSMTSHFAIFFMFHNFILAKAVFGSGNTFLAIRK